MREDEKRRDRVRNRGEGREQREERQIKREWEAGEEKEKEMEGGRWTMRAGWDNGRRGGQKNGD